MLSYSATEINEALLGEPLSGCFMVYFTSNDRPGRLFYRVSHQGSFTPLSSFEPVLNGFIKWKSARTMKYVH